MTSAPEHATNVYIPSGGHPVGAVVSEPDGMDTEVKTGYVSVDDSVQTDSIGSLGTPPLSVAIEGGVLSCQPRKETS